MLLCLSEIWRTVLPSPERSTSLPDDAGIRASISAGGEEVAEEEAY
jgi:hypothetical protein